MPFKPKHLRNFSQQELEALEKLNLPDSIQSASGTDSPIRPSKMTGLNIVQGAAAAPKVDLEKLERAAEGAQPNGVNGHS